MNLLAVFAAGLAVVVQGSTTPPLATEINSSCLRDDHSLLSSLLKVAGYSDSCVAAALDSCSTLEEEASHHTSLVEEARGMVQQATQALNEWKSRPRHCKDLLDSGDNESGVRQVYPYPGEPHHRVTVYCNHSVDGGGWTVFQRRSNDVVREDFYRTWIEYKLGFGNLTGEFWLGLDLLHQLTSTILQQLRIDMDDYEGGQRWAKYGFFHVGGPEVKYRLSVGRYTGDAGDSLIQPHHGQSFTTHDADNDIWNENCAVKFRGAWWHKDCHKSNLNGYQYEGSHSSFADGIIWHSWRGHYYSLRETSMMIRPAF